MSLKPTRAMRTLVFAGAAAALMPLTFPAFGTLAAQQDTTVKLLQETAWAQHQETAAALKK